MHYTSVRREANGSGWRTDYPWAQRNLLLRLSQLTKARVSVRSPGVPHVWLVQLTDPQALQLRKRGGDSPRIRRDPRLMLDLLLAAA